ncbi:14377_t:CDS:2, partial [Racocetra fulgida]
MEDKLIIATLEVDVDSPILNIKHTFPPFEVECTITTTTILEVEEASSNLEVGITSSVLEVEKTSSGLEVDVISYSLSYALEVNKTPTSLEVKVISPSLTCAKFAFPVSAFQYTETTSPIYTYQPSEVTPLNFIQQYIDVASPSNYQYNLQKGDVFDDWSSVNSTQSVESFNSIIKKSLNSASILYNVEKIIKKRLDDESQYNKLILEIDTVNDAFIEDVSDESQITLKSLLNGVKLEHNDVIRHATPLRNQFEIAFSVFKTAINIVLEVKSDEELIQMLKNFIIIKWQAKVSTRHDSNNSCNDNTKNELDKVVPLQQQLISQITEPKVVKIHSAPSKKKIKSFAEVLKKRADVQESNYGET